MTVIPFALVRLSGGQRKRVSIAVELLADPKLFFLDEPTSGLDPGLDKEMMQLLRELANQGRTIVLVTHATSNIEVCDRIAFMGRGGQLCYFGPPQEAMDFFEMPSQDLKYFSDIYIKLDQGKTPAQVEENVISLGLMVSAFVDNETEANNSLTLILLPQIILSGVLFKLEGLASKLSWLTISRWSVGAYGTLANVNAMVPQQTPIPGFEPPPLPFEPTAVYESTMENLSFNWGILCLHTIVYLAIALWNQKRKDIF